MRFDPDKQNKILEKAKQLLEKAEVARRQQRVLKGTDHFVAGDHKLLLNNEFVQELTELAQQKSVEDGFYLFEALLQCLDEESKDIRHCALSLLSMFLERDSFVLDNEKTLFVLGVMKKWYAFEDEYFPGLAQINEQSCLICNNLLRHKQYEVAEGFLSVFARIRNGVLFKEERIKQDIANSLQNLVTKELLELLFKEYSDDEGERRIIASIFVDLGGKAASYLLRNMMHCRSNADRLLLTDLLTCYGGVVVPLLSDCLGKNPPWFVVRNILCIFGGMEDSSLYGDIKHYASYSDVRVQQEFVKAVVRMGGARLNDRLIEVLPKVDEALQVRLVYKLSEQNNPEILEQLGNFLESSLHVLLHREDVLIALTISLQQLPSERTLFLLRVLRDECTMRPRLSRLMNAVNEALSVTEPALRHKKRKLSEDNDNTISFAHDPHEHNNALKLVREIKKKVDSVLARGEVVKVSEILYEEGLRFAREGQPAAATMLLEQLMTTCPEALEKVVALGDQIEIESDHKRTQFSVLASSLKDYFNKEELAALVPFMVVEGYRAGEYIVKRGETDFTLYFVLTGILQLQWENETRNTFLKRLRLGESLGKDHFLDASLWTVNVLAATDATLAVLSHQDYKVAIQRFPGLEQKMVFFCNSGHTTSSLLKMSGEERRKYPRFSSQLPVSIRVIDLFGKQMSRSLKGRLLDVSEGGLSLLVRFASDNILHNFLGRQVFTELSFNDASVIECRGRVVSARVVDGEDQKYSLHVDLSEPLPQEELKRLLDV